MRIEQLIAFDKVVQHSSFTKAANELYTTQPSVSKMIDALEDELGHQLLRRTSRGIELTAYGKWVYGDVKIILQMVNGWQESTPLEEVPREVHIQSTTTMCNFLSAGFIPCLKDRHPDINLLLHECRRSEIIHKMEENGVHIGLLPIRKENQADSTATLERIRAEELRTEVVGVDYDALCDAVEQLEATYRAGWWRAAEREGADFFLREVEALNRLNVPAVRANWRDAGKITGILRKMPVSTLRRVARTSNPMALRLMVLFNLQAGYRDGSFDKTISIPRLIHTRTSEYRAEYRAGSAA